MDKKASNTNPKKNRKSKVSRRSGRGKRYLVTADLAQGYSWSPEGLFLERLADLALFGLKKLSKDRKGQHSIRINDQYRICFEWTEAGPREVEITDYH